MLDKVHFGSQYVADLKNQPVKVEEQKTAPVVEKEPAKILLFERNLETKSQRKEARKQAEADFLKFGTDTGLKVAEEKDAKKMAKNYVNNKRNMQNFEATEVFIDKGAYKAAKKQRKEDKKDLVKQYREQGLSRKEARKLADSQLVENEYVRGKRTRAYVENNRALFYDENGKFSSDKFKEKALVFANYSNKAEGEAINYHLGLKERRAVAEKEGLNANVVKNFAKKSNLSYEKDHTNLYKGLIIAGCTGAGALAGPLFGSSAAAASAAAASSSVATTTIAATSSSSAAASAAAKTNGTGIGIGVGAALGLGLSNFVKDKGNTEVKVYNPGSEKIEKIKEEPDPVPPKNNENPINTQPNPLPEEIPCPEERWESPYCDYTVKKGDYWAAVVQGTMTVNGKKPDGKLLTAIVHAEKLKHGVTDFSKNTMPAVNEKMRLYTDFSDLVENEELVKKHPELKLLKDANIEINCDGKVVTQKFNKKPTTPFERWKGTAVDTNKYKQDCHDEFPVRIK